MAEGLSLEILFCLLFALLQGFFDGLIHVAAELQRVKGVKALDWRKWKVSSNQLFVSDSKDTLGIGFAFCKYSGTLVRWSQLVDDLVITVPCHYRQSQQEK